MHAYAHLWSPNDSGKQLTFGAISFITWLYMTRFVKTDPNHTRNEIHFIA